MDKRKGKDLIIWTVVIALDLIGVYLNSSTYDSGDSILHYLYSHQAFEYPKYFMDHWAKPVFVLISAPFAWFGWNGMKLFNALCVIASSWYTFQLFRHYHFPKWLAVLLCFAAPHFFLVQSSGLTEPLFGLFLVATVYYFKADKNVLAMILLSFLPFVRSEGWVIMPIVAVYAFQDKKLRSLPWILTGTIVYGIAGFFYYQDFLWMFAQNPYSGVEEHYGHGHALHFINQLGYIIGFALYFFVLLGIYRGLRLTMSRQIDNVEFFLIYGISIGYIVAHSIFWTQGWFHSLGMSRVLIVIIPLLSFIAFRGMEQLECAFGPFVGKKARIFSIALVVIFPFIGNPSSFHFPEDFQLSADQVQTAKAVEDVQSVTIAAFESHTIYYGNVYIPFLLGLDIDDPIVCRRIGAIKEDGIKPGSIILWDNYFSVRDQGVNRADLSAISLYKEYKCQDCKFNYELALYIEKGPAPDSIAIHSIINNKEGSLHTFLNPNINDTIADSSHSVLVEMLLKEGFEKSVNGKGNHPLGPRHVSYTMKRSDCECEIGLFYDRSYADPSYEMRETIRCK